VFENKNTGKPLALLLFRLGTLKNDTELGVCGLVSEGILNASETHTHTHTAVMVQEWRVFVSEDILNSSDNICSVLFRKVYSIQVTTFAVFCFGRYTQFK
jgi:hypothetical protein